MNQFNSECFNNYDYLSSIVRANNEETKIFYMKKSYNILKKNNNFTKCNHAFIKVPKSGNKFGIKLWKCQNCDKIVQAS